jgi:hypothetical protein
MSTETDFMMDEAKCDARESSANAVGRIVIGHTTDTTVRIWVQGSSRYPRVRLAVRPAGQPWTDPVLEPEGLVLKKQDYTACFDFDHLTASSTYEVTAFFTHWTAGCLSWPKSRRVTGVFKTFPCSDPAKAEPFSFLLGSCNLPVVEINNLAALALQWVGFSIAARSLERLRQPWGRLLGLLIRFSLWLVFRSTGGKWSQQPLLRSPFLKLAGLFAGHRIDFRDGRRAPLAGQTLIGSRSKESGVLAFDPVVEFGSWRDARPEKAAKGFMILTDTCGGFQAGESLKTSQGDEIAQVNGSSRFEPPDLPEPAFTIHAGDLIYYDFPWWDLEPRLDSYRDAYRKGWFEERFQRFFLARGSHYMTLDDHEIVDGFANDIVLPRPYEVASAGRRFPPERYLEAARRAYEEYVHSRHPDDAQISASSRFEPESLPEPARWLMRQPWCRWLLGPLLRSRFLNLAGKFAGYRIDFKGGRARPLVGQTLVGSRSKESGILASVPVVELGSWGDGNAQGFMILTDTRGGFQTGEGLRIRDRSLYYDFRHGAARFFVMDTRTRRYRDSGSQIIDDAQMKAFKEWLESGEEDLKFVVSSVPFVAEVLQSEGTQGARDSADDKWCGGPFRRQRDEIIDFIEDKKIERVVFLVGDMHCAYHASMSIGDSHRWVRRTVHELAGGPINQLDLGRREQFAAFARRSTRDGQIPYQIRLHQFHGDASAVMHIQVTSAPDPRDRVAGTEVPEIVWRAIRTLTDPEALRDPDTEASRTKDRQSNPKILIKDHPPISGRITFGRRCGLDQLPAW